MCCCMKSRTVGSSVFGPGAGVRLFCCGVELSYGFRFSVFSLSRSLIRSGICAVNHRCWMTTFRLARFSGFTVSILRSRSAHSKHENINKHRNMGLTNGHEKRDAQTVHPTQPSSNYQQCHLETEILRLPKCTKQHQVTRHPTFDHRILVPTTVLKMRVDEM